ncbi:MAG: histidinol-phosphatase HisJ family protein [Clostridia bacterium]|nr:histidinol-phosphatase HisJ family protein [Clostridia bacterium]
MIRQNLHMHSTWDDGQNTVEEMILASKAAGLSSVGVSVHSPLPYGTSWACPEAKLPAYISEVRALQKKYEGVMDVYLGIEWDAESPVDPAQYDYAIGSVHHIPVACLPPENCPEELREMLSMDYPTVDESAEATQKMLRAYFDDDADALARAYFAQYQKIAAQEKAQIVGHFDLLTKFDERRGFFHPQSRAYRKAALDAMEMLVKAKKIFEVNTGAISRGYRSEPYPSRELLCALRETGGKVTVSADAHHVSGVTCAFEAAERIVRECGFKEIWVLTKDGFMPEAL